MFYVNRRGPLDTSLGRGSAGDNDRGELYPRESESWRRLEKNIRLIPAFDLHVVPGNECAILDRLLDSHLIGKSNDASMGLLEVACRLFGMPEDGIDAEKAETLRKRHAAFFNTHTPEEYYHQVGGMAGVRFTGVLETPEHLVNPEMDHTRIVSVAPLDRLVRPSVFMPAPSGPRSFPELLTHLGNEIALLCSTPHTAAGCLNLCAWRTLEVRNREEAEVRRAYEKASPSEEEQRAVEDFLIFHVFRLCGENGLPIQLHTGALNTNEARLLDTNPALMQDLLRRAELAATRVVLLGGSYPYTREAGLLCRSGNCCLDLSWLSSAFSPQVVAAQLHEWMELTGPRKILFGTGAGGLDVVRGAWCVRRALALTLGDMMSEGRLTESEALAIAREVLSGNARRVYGLTVPV